MNCGPLMGPALAHAVLKGIIPLARAGMIMYSELGLYERLGIVLWLQTARDTMLVAGAALIILVASATPGCESGTHQYEQRLGRSRTRTSRSCSLLQSSNSLRCSLAHVWYTRIRASPSRSACPMQCSHTVRGEHSCNRKNLNDWLFDIMRRFNEHALALSLFAIEYTPCTSFENRSLATEQHENNKEQRCHPHEPRITCMHVLRDPA